MKASTTRVTKSEQAHMDASRPAIQQYLMRGIQSPLARRAMMSRGTRGIATYAPAAGLLSSED